MTVKQLIARLQSLPESAQELPVKLQYMEEGPESQESRRVSEEIDTVIPPQAYGVEKGCVTVVAWLA
jgi:hypothetical protein